jgi:hypothetical protein
MQGDIQMTAKFKAASLDRWFSARELAGRLARWDPTSAMRVAGSRVEMVAAAIQPITWKGERKIEAINRISLTSQDRFSLSGDQAA